MLKRYLSFFLIFFLIFFNSIFVKADTVTVDKAKIAKEMSEALKREFILDESTIQASSFSVSNAAKIIAPAAASVAPEIAAIAVIGIGAGYVYHNRDEILTNAYNVYQMMKTNGQTITRNSDGSVTLNQTQIDSITNIMKDFKDKGVSSSFPLTFNTDSAITGLSFYFSGGSTYSGSFSKSVPSITSFSTVFNHNFYLSYNNTSEMIGNYYYTTDVTNLVGVGVLQGTWHYYGNCGQNNPVPSDSCNYIPTVNSVPDLQVGTGTGTVNFPSDLVANDLDNFTGIQTNGQPYTSTDPSTDPTTDPTTGTNTKTATSEDVKNQTDSILDTGTQIDFGPLKVAGETFTTRFPFSLPWDLLHSFTCLKVSSIKPRFYFDMSNIPLGTICGWNSFEVDLTDYNDLFAMVKFFELLAFDIGLVFATRKLMGGSV